MRIATYVHPILIVFAVVCCSSAKNSRGLTTVDVVGTSAKYSDRRTVVNTDAHIRPSFDLPKRVVDKNKTMNITFCPESDNDECLNMLTDSKLDLQNVSVHLPSIRKTSATSPLVTINPLLTKLYETINHEDRSDITNAGKCFVDIKSEENVPPDSPSSELSFVEATADNMSYLHDNAFSYNSRVTKHLKPELVVNNTNGEKSLEITKETASVINKRATDLNSLRRSLQEATNTREQNVKKVNALIETYLNNKVINPMVKKYEDFGNTNSADGTESSSDSVIKADADQSGHVLPPASEQSSNLRDDRSFGLHSQGRGSNSQDHLRNAEDIAHAYQKLSETEKLKRCKNILDSISSCHLQIYAKNRLRNTETSVPGLDGKLPNSEEWRDALEKCLHYYDKYHKRQKRQTQASADVSPAEAKDRQKRYYFDYDFGSIGTTELYPDPGSLFDGWRSIRRSYYNNNLKKFPYRSDSAPLEDHTNSGSQQHLPFKDQSATEFSSLPYAILGNLNPNGQETLIDEEEGSRNEVLVPKLKNSNFATSSLIKNTPNSASNERGFLKHHFSGSSGYQSKADGNSLTYNEYGTSQNQPADDYHQKDYESFDDSPDVTYNENHFKDFSIRPEDSAFSRNIQNLIYKGREMAQDHLTDIGMYGQKNIGSVGNSFSLGYKENETPQNHLLATDTNNYNQAMDNEDHTKYLKPPYNPFLASNGIDTYSSDLGKSEYSSSDGRILQNDGSNNMPDTLSYSPGTRTNYPQTKKVENNNADTFSDDLVNEQNYYINQASNNNIQSEKPMLSTDQHPPAEHRGFYPHNENMMHPYHETKQIFGLEHQLMKDEMDNGVDTDSEYGDVNVPDEMTDQASYTTDHQGSPLPKDSSIGLPKNYNGNRGNVHLFYKTKQKLSSQSPVNRRQFHSVKHAKKHHDRKYQNAGTLFKKKESTNLEFHKGSKTLKHQKHKNHYTLNVRNDYNGMGARPYRQSKIKKNTARQYRKPKIKKSTQYGIFQQRNLHPKTKHRLVRTDDTQLNIEHLRDVEPDEHDSLVGDYSPENELQYQDIEQLGGRGMEPDMYVLANANEAVVEGEDQVQGDYGEGVPLEALSPDVRSPDAESPDAQSDDAPTLDAQSAADQSPVDPSTYEQYSDTDKMVAAISCKTDFPCHLNGSWFSEAGGVIINVNLNAYDDMNVTIRSDVPTYTKAGILSDSWLISGEMPFRPTVKSIIYLKAEEPSERQLATFIGECFTCSGEEVIYGSWLVVRPAHGCKDIYSTIEDYRDVFRRAVLSSYIKDTRDKKSIGRSSRGSLRRSSHGSSHACSEGCHLID